MHHAQRRFARIRRAARPVTRTRTRSTSPSPSVTLTPTLTLALTPSPPPTLTGYASLGVLLLLAVHGLSALSWSSLLLAYAAAAVALPRLERRAAAGGG